MNEYAIRKATTRDIPFLVKTVVAAEKSGSDKLSYCTLFGIDEQTAGSFIKTMFEEEIDGCEFSVNSFLIAEYAGSPVAAFGGWVETLNEDELPSKILKSNLISYTFGKEAMESLKSKAGFISELVSERAPFTLQLEYLYVVAEHRGKGIPGMLIEALENAAFQQYPALKSAQVQVYANNTGAINVYKKSGFQIQQVYKTNNQEVLTLLPYNEKCIMQKNF